MELTRNHRLELMDQLYKAEKERFYIQKELSQAPGEDNKNFLEVRHVLIVNRIETIKQILVDGEMDY